MALSSAERQERYRAKKRASPAVTVKNETGWQKTDDLIEMLESLPRIRVGQDGYEEKDRAQDFISTFSTESGRRVLSQIASICDPSPRLDDADRHGTLAMKAGMRFVMTQIQRCFVIRAPITTERTTDVGSDT